jgi:uncharacterized protein (TIGR03435 family)
MLRLILLMFSLAVPRTLAQQAIPTAIPSAAPISSFEVATIKPCDPTAPGQHLGFESRPGGRVFVGCASVKMLAYYAFGLPEDRIVGGPGWIDSARYNIEAVPPDNSATRTADQPPVSATPSAEQRQMLQAMLSDRFKLQSHQESHEGDVYLLALGSGKLKMQSQDQGQDVQARDSRGNIGASGEAFGENVSMTFLSELLTRRLGLPVLDRTGLSGRYDFDLPPIDPDNKDIALAVIGVMDRLGMKLKRGRGPVPTLVIDHVERPTAN